MRFSVLHCVAVYGNVLQCVAVCCSVLKCVAVCCSVLQCVAVYWIYASTRCPMSHIEWIMFAVRCSVLQCVLQCVAVCCSQYAMSYISYWMNHVRSALQCVAVHCSVLQCFALMLVLQCVFPQVQNFFFLQHSCAVKCLKRNRHNKKRPTKKLSQSHTLKLFSTLHRTEDSEYSDLEPKSKTQTALASKFPVWSNRIPNSNGKTRKKKPIVCFGHTSFVSLKKLGKIQTFLMSVTNLKVWPCATVIYVTKHHKWSHIWCDV